MKGNTDKSHLIISTNNTSELKVGDSLVKTSTCEKILGVEIDYKLTIDNHVPNLCKKANNKLRALARATSYMTIEKRKLLINSQLNYYHSPPPLHPHSPLYECYTAVAITPKSSI